MPSARVRKSKNLIGWQLARIGLAFINVPWFVTILVLLARHIGRRWMDYKILVSVHQHFKKSEERACTFAALWYNSGMDKVYKKFCLQ